MGNSVGKRGCDYSIGNVCPECGKSLRTDGQYIWCSYLKCELYAVIYDMEMVLVPQELR